MGSLILIKGPNNSGKSEYAEKLATGSSEERFYIATMIPVTEDNHEHIMRHIERRKDMAFTTFELPYEVGSAPVTTSSAVLLEDVSNLLANVMFGKKGDIDSVFKDICRLKESCSVLIAVSISGLDEAKYEGETADYIRALAELNRRLERISERTEDMSKSVRGERYNAF